MPGLGYLSTIGQALSLLLVGLLAGSMYGIWFGYDITRYSPTSFVEVHQGAVRGLNTLLPLMGLAAIVMVVVLAVLARQRPTVLMLYGAAALGLVAAGLITRLLNQPINDAVMGWSADALPTDWETLRNSWWSWHAARLGATILALLLLIAAVFTDRSA
ncbi:hypothetical protein ASC89_11870 [Devosia sp. Root413D1]|uniref:anthrone oxygenase family protein n=1 Tax=Devosia sp. Root413D1 TaxID=1736531 RepID=UPI0006FB5029|nr:anthrone oxygenase family protein [Devosia sp. Root413D1]KQW78999.1 hypothetical protein ASC89_11870 [Devosia sp. Root413D1]